MKIKPATWARRLMAQILDLGILGLLLILLARQLPEGPPPADSMAFFTKQDFINYFLLVAVALALTIVAFQFMKATRATPGQMLLQLQLTALDGTEPTSAQIDTRLRTALMNILLIMLPGPIIALVVGGSVAAVLDVPFATTDKLLMKLEIPAGIRYAIHSVSFLALLAAIWAVTIRPVMAYFENLNNGLTRLDLKSGTSHVRTDDA
jgi:ABC-type uncharacterized transport system permease subunit